MRKNSWNGVWFRVLCVFMVFVAGCSESLTQGPVSKDSVSGADGQPLSEGQRQAEAAGNVDPDSDSAFKSLWDDCLTLPEVIVDESRHIVSDNKNATFLLLAGGGSVALHASGIDSKWGEDFQRHSFLSKTADETVYFLGGPGFHFAASGIWYLASAGNDDLVGQERAWTMFKALSITSATTLGMKLIRNNRTPNDKPLAWPSGHTSSSFTVAAVLDEMYGPQVGVPAYLGAGFVGYRMMESGDHWASDVLFGAVLGWIVGHHIGGEHNELELAGFEVMPYTDIQNGESMMGVSLFKRF